MRSDADDIEAAVAHLGHHRGYLGGADIESNDDVGASSRHVLARLLVVR
jgi:hypothetical protein